MADLKKSEDIVAKELRPLPALIFGSRLLQLPLNLGLIIAQGIYVILFLRGLWHLIKEATTLTEQAMMLMVLGLIDVVMISNLVNDLDFAAVLPEILLLCGACVVLLGDLFLADARRHVSFWLTQAVLVAVAYSALWVMPPQPAEAFSGMVVDDMLA
ncbi:MAG: YqhA family protein, partial [Pseudorhodoplanes sp.]